MTNSKDTSNAGGRWNRFFYFPAARLVFLGYAVLSVGWFYISPGGFLWREPRFWSNGTIPLFVFAISVLGLVGLNKHPQRSAGAVLLFYAAAMLTFTANAKMLYPISLRPVFLYILIGWFLFLTLLLTACARTSGHWTDVLFIVPFLLAGAAAGFFLPWSQIGLAPGTRPANSTIRPSSEPLNPQHFLSLPGGVSVDALRACVEFSHGGCRLEVLPLLTFYSRSPDQCWVLFAPRSDRCGPQRLYNGMKVIPNGLYLEYEYDGLSCFEVREEEGVFAIDARTRLPQPVYSHLNTFSHLRIEAGEAISVSFSPCPDRRIEVLPFEYPFGLPARFAYLDRDNKFRIVQAKRAEKGPYTTLAEGALSRGESLGLTLYAGGRSVYRITFEDWSAQVSMQTSPTAGWGVPENAVEFSLEREKPYVASFYLTLSATSVGRGFDSVGHAAGAYRNRIRIETPEE